MRRLLALLILGALVLGAVYVWKYQPNRLPRLRSDKLGEVGSKLGQVGGAVEEKLRATKTKGAVKAALELNRSLSAYAIDVDAHDREEQGLFPALPRGPRKGPHRPPPAR